MPGFARMSQLVAAKKRLGQIEFIDFGTLDLVAAHRKLGAEVKDQTHKIVDRKLAKLDRERLIAHIRVARQCRRAIEAKIASTSIDSRIRTALSEYLACLSAWSMGAQLAQVQHEHPSVDGLAISADELALFLQNDNSGCQTGVYRAKEGAVILWHTEEDVAKEPDGRFDKPRIATFRIKENDQAIEINAFIYPDLLPGPAYSWRSDGFAQAVDTLHLRPRTQEGHILANIATWITLRLGREIPQAEVIKALGPFVDGYALTVVQERDGYTAANRIEFGGDQWLGSSLGDEPGSFLFQVNILSEKAAPIAATCEDIDAATRQFFKERICRTERALREIKLAEDALAGLFRLVSSRLGGDNAYANEDVKSYFITKLSSRGAEIWLGAGPALREESPKIIMTQG